MERIFELFKTFSKCSRRHGKNLVGSKITTNINFCYFELNIFNVKKKFWSFSLSFLQIKNLSFFTLNKRQQKFRNKLNRKLNSWCVVNKMEKKNKHNETLKIYLD